MNRGRHRLLQPDEQFFALLVVFSGTQKPREPFHLRVDSIQLCQVFLVVFGHGLPFFFLRETLPLLVEGFEILVLRRDVFNHAIPVLPFDHILNELHGCVVFREKADVRGLEAYNLRVKDFDALSVFFMYRNGITRDSFVVGCLVPTSVQGLAKGTFADDACDLVKATNTRGLLFARIQEELYIILMRIAEPRLQEM